MADTEPVVVGLGFAAVGQVGLALVADVKQVAEHLDLIALLTFTEQGGNRHVQVLAEQIKQRSLQCGYCVNGDTQVEGLQTSAARIAIGEGFARLVEDLLVRADAAADHQ